ncbi:MAG: hypothetical protein UHN02_01620 [Acutalibacteraceae bacterium]|nr:hypothetical protein [Acutalibacteraceae bacterium]
MIKNACLVGNDKLLSQIENMAANKRLPHVMIIEGDAFCGRKTLSGYIARLAACTGENPLCGKCSACVLKDNPDISLISPNEKGIISVDTARKIRNDAYILPNNSNKRVFIIDNAGRMNQAAQNALLKVIEEPPEKSMFIFICNYTSELIDTVRSRCVLMHIDLPDEKQAVDYIMNNYGFSQQDTEFEVRRFSGNIGKSLNALNGDEGYYKLALKIAETSIDSEINTQKLFIEYVRDIKALKQITKELYTVYHNLLVAKQGIYKGEEYSDICKKATKHGLFNAAKCCERALEDFNATIPLNPADGELYITNLCTCICESFRV